MKQTQNNDAHIEYENMTLSLKKKHLLLQERSIITQKIK